MPDVTIQLDSAIFRAAEVRRAISNAVRKQARIYKREVVRRMVESKPRGRVYPRRRGKGFKRFHRASALGQRPAVDTGTLINAVEDRSVSEFSAVVQIGHRYNRRQNARDYARILQERLGRPIMTDQDARNVEDEFRARIERAINALI